MRKHDENKCVRIISTRCRVSLYDKAIEASKGTIIGNKMWGRIDFLVNHCGYRFYWTTGPVSVVKVSSSDYKDTKRALKKAAKEQTLTDKTKRKKK